MFSNLKKRPALMMLLILGCLLFGVSAWYFSQAYPFYVKIQQDPTIDVGIEIYHLDGAAGVRVVPEWAPAAGVLVACPFHLPSGVLHEISLEHKLFIITDEEAQKANCLDELSEHAISLNNVEFIFSRHSDGHKWTRDWGPYPVSKNGMLYLVDANFHDYTYSRYDSQNNLIRTLSNWIPFYSTEQDDEAPGAVADYFDLPREEVSIALTGGTAMFDGQGTLFIHRVTIDENIYLGHTFEEFQEQLATSFGVSRLIVLPNYESWGLQHIDCLLKLLDENRILVKRLESSHPDHQRVELIAEALSELKTLDGKNYEILRIDTPNYAEGRAAPYTNSLIFNNKVFVPLMGIPGDEEAINTWKEAMPGYEVFGYQMQGEMWPWFEYDALHCRTKSIVITEVVDESGGQD